jgi:hypothetical protein
MPAPSHLTDQHTSDRHDADVNLEDETDVEDWCRSFACTAGELRAAVKAVGPSTKRVRVFLRDRQQAAE